MSPASEAQLAKIVLQPADLPAGWEHTPHQSDAAAVAAANTADAATAKCLGVPNWETEKVAEVHSDDFVQGDAQVTSDASSYPSQSMVDADAAALHSPKASLCYEQALRQSIAAAAPAEATIESASFKITPGSAGGPANVVARGAATFKISASGIAADGYGSIAFITGPMIKASVTGFNIGAPVPTSPMDSLIAAVANRAAHP